MITVKVYKVFFSFLLTAAVCSHCYGQYTLRLVVPSTGAKSNDDIYVASSFNDWKPNDANYKLKPFGGSRKVLVLKNLPAGHYEYKFTRGDWSKVETTAKGDDVANHSVELQADTSVEYTVPGWKDDYPDKPKPYTASANVYLVDSAFFIPELNAKRRIWIYLPASYNSTKGKTYPVLYMHDGQNIFNERTAAFGEWGVDECLDTLQKKLNKECIVVGIANGDSARMREYNPYDNTQYGKEEGKEYADFLAKTLKPFIDKNYRTIPDAKHTFIAGSSMGGLISMYAIIKYPDVFGSAGIFSPSFWLAPQIYTDVQAAKLPNTARIFLYAGGKESKTMMTDLQKMFNILKTKPCASVIETYPLGQHSEKYWREEFDDFYYWLMR